MLVIILFLIKIYFVHLNLSSTLNFQLLYNENEIPIQETGEVAIQMETFSDVTSHQISYGHIYPSETQFREYIAPTLNSEKLCNLYKLFYSTNPFIPHQNFLPPERFCKSHAVLTIPELEQKILYNFHCRAHEPKNQFSQFQPILYNPTAKTFETGNFGDFENIPDGCFLAKIGKKVFPFRPELNSKPLHTENKTAMIVICETQYYLILEDSTDQNFKQYSVICYGKYERIFNDSVLLYKCPDVAYERENIEYPKDINFIFKAKYMKGIQNYFFKFQYGHIKICQKAFKNWSWFLKKLSDFSYNVLNNDDKSCLRYTVIFFLFYFVFLIELAKRLIKFKQDNFESRIMKGFQLVAKGLIYLFQAYNWLASYKIIFGILFSPLYFYFPPQIFFLTLNLEPLTAVLFWGPTYVYTSLQSSKQSFQIYPVEQMFSIPTLKTPCRYIFQEFVHVWLIMVALTSFVYAFLPEQKIPGEFFLE